MDFQITTENGLGEMTFTKADSVLNNIYLSLEVEKGSFFQNPEFGSRLNILKREKLTDRTISLAKEYVKESLQWLLDIGRVTQIETEAERNTNDRNRLDIMVRVTQADGREISFDTFFEVV